MSRVAKNNTLYCARVTKPATITPYIRKYLTATKILHHNADYKVNHFNCKLHIVFVHHVVATMAASVNLQFIE